jgi:hypothetical protein
VEQAQDGITKARDELQRMSDQLAAEVEERNGLQEKLDK